MSAPHLTVVPFLKEPLKVRLLKEPLNKGTPRVIEVLMSDPD